MAVLERSLSNYQNYNDLVKRIEKGGDVWVRFINPKQHRYGSIGIIRADQNVRKISSYSYARGTGTLTIDYYVRVEFPDTDTNQIVISSNRYDILKQVEWLDGYTGPAVRNKVKPTAEPAAVVYDMHDIQIEVGHFCAFNSGNQLMFGSVASISHGGIVFLNKVNGGKTRVLKTKNLAVINPDFRKMMMLRKLAA